MKLAFWVRTRKLLQHDHICCVSTEHSSNGKGANFETHLGLRIMICFFRLDLSTLLEGTENKHGQQRQSLINASFFLGSRLGLSWKLPTFCGNFPHNEAIFMNSFHSKGNYNAT